MLHKLKHGLRSVAKKANARVTRYAERKQIGRKEMMSVRDVFFMQFDKQELKRYDIVVRYLAIEHHLGVNDDGFDLYRKMQNARIREGYGEEAERQFRALIDSYQKNGYERASHIVVDKNLSLIDGSHRIALNIYFGIEEINVLVLPTEKLVDYTIDWFFQNGFTDTEIDRILAKGKELTEKANTGFSCMIWSPAAALSDALIKDLSYFGRTDGVKRYAFSPAEYRNAVKAIYAADDIADWKVQTKLEHMRQPAPEIVSVRFYPNCPDFRLKGATGMPLSRTGERVKKNLRMRYRDQIEDYYFDVILHMSDNFRQSAYMFRVLEPDIDMTEILGILSRYSYALAKTDSSYYPADFPRHIPVGKDADILCLPEEAEQIVEELKRTTEKYSVYEMRVLREVYGTRIRLEKMGCLIYQFDVSWRVAGLADDFIADALKDREQHGTYMRLSAPYEYLYRIVSYQENKTKSQHLEYLRNHRADFDPAMLKKYTKLSEKAYEKLLQEDGL